MVAQIECNFNLRVQLDFVLNKIEYNFILEFMFYNTNFP